MTLDQILTAFRYAGTAAGAVFTTLGVLSLIPPDTAHAIVAQLQLVAKDANQLVTDAWALGILIAPFAIAWMAKIGVHLSSPKAVIAQVQAMPNAQVLVTDPALLSSGVKLVPKDHLMME